MIDPCELLSSEGKKTPSGCRGSQGILSSLESNLPTRKGKGESQAEEEEREDRGAGMNKKLKD